MQAMGLLRTLARTGRGTRRRRATCQMSTGIGWASWTCPQVGSMPGLICHAHRISSYITGMQLCRKR
jgi:hypothetical protein